MNCHHFFPRDVWYLLVTNGNLSILFFYMGVNSIRADKLLPLVLKILKKKLLPLDSFCLCRSKLFLFDGHFMTFFLVQYF